MLLIIKERRCNKHSVVLENIFMEDNKKKKIIRKGASL